MKYAAQFIALVRQAEAIIASDMTWNTKYETVFNFIQTEIGKLGIWVEWCDMDEGYEEDVRAYVKALTEKAKEASSGLNPAFWGDNGFLSELKGLLEKYDCSIQFSADGYLRNLHDEKLEIVDNKTDLPFFKVDGYYLTAKNIKTN
jgi:hypothetical protein